MLLPSQVLTSISYGKSLINRSAARLFAPLASGGRATNSRLANSRAAKMFTRPTNVNKLSDTDDAEDFELEELTTPLRDRLGSMVTQEVDVLGSVELSKQKMMDSQLKSVDLNMSRVFASGHMFTASLLDKLLGETFYNPRLLCMIEALLQGDGHLNTLYTRRVPSIMHGRRFVDLFDFFVREQHLTPIGLYRNTRDSSNNPVLYCYTNPLEKTVVSRRDHVFVIGKALNWSP